MPIFFQRRLYLFLNFLISWLEALRRIYVYDDAENQTNSSYCVLIDTNENLSILHLGKIIIL